MKEELTEESNIAYAFEGFCLERGKRLLFDPEGQAVPLVPKAFDILLYFLTNADRVLEKDELMRAIWPDTAVEENNLTQNISSIRKALGERHKENRFIATLPGRGYKFVAKVRKVESNRVSANLAIDQVAGQEKSEVRQTSLAKIAVALIAVALFGLAAVLLWPSSSADVRIGSIAVLPFKPIASERSDESLEMGMADTLILKLGGIRDLKVRPLTAVRRFSAPDQDAVAAGRELGVDAVLEGRLQSSSDRIRANVQLVRIQDGELVWSGQFDEKLTDIFTLQDSIAQRVASQLRVSLGGQGTKRYTESIEAYQLYLRGNLHVRRLIRPEVEKGIDYYNKAIQADPEFALAYVEMANANRALVLSGDAPPYELMPKAGAAARKAVELDPELGEAWTALAVSDFWYDWNWKAAEEHHRKALDLDGSNVSARTFYAHFLSNMGRHDEAITEIRRAREADPVSLITNAIEGQILFFAGRRSEAEETLKRTADLDPSFWLAPLFLTRIYLSEEKFDDAVGSARRAADLSGGNAEATAMIAYSLAKGGRGEEARAVLGQLLDRGDGRYVSKYALAQVYLAWDDRVKTLELLNAAFEAREPLLTFLKVEPKWDPIRQDPRFVDLIRRMNF